MPLNANKLPKKQGGVKQDPLEPGTYPARVVQILDLGLQPQKPHKGKEKPPAYSIMLTYELLDEFMKDKDGNDLEDKPRWVSETMPFYSLTADKAKSTKRYLALDPEQDFGGDFTRLVNVPCMVTLVNNVRDGNTYTNVASIAAMRPKEAAKAADLVNAPVIFTLDDPDMAVFNELPEWIQDKIKGNLEFTGSVLEARLAGKEVPQAEEEEEEESADESW